MQPTIKKAESENSKAIKKAEGDLKKEGDKRSKASIKAAKDVDKQINKQYKNVAAKASLKAFPPAKDSLA